MRNYFQRQIDLGKTELEHAANKADTQKSRGEPTAPLPAPSAIVKRRLEQSTLSRSRPSPVSVTSELTEASIPNPPYKGRSPTPPVLNSHLMMDRDRVPASFSQTPNPPPVPSLPPLEGFSFPMRSQSTASTLPGPRLGHYNGDRLRDMSFSHMVQPAIPLERLDSPAKPDIIPLKDSGSMSRGYASPNMIRPAEIPTSQAFNKADYVRYPKLPQIHSLQPLSSTSGVQSPWFLPPPSGNGTITPSQSHSRRIQTPHLPSMSHPPPVEPPQIRIPTPGIPPAHMLSMPQPQRPPLFSGVNSTSDMSAHPRSPSHAPGEKPKHIIPAKRSNIMNILNNEPEDPHPRKRPEISQSQPPPSRTQTPLPPPSAMLQDRTGSSSVPAWKYRLGLD